jgi:hypothetical protein
MMRAIIGLTTAYVLVIAFGFDRASGISQMLSTQALFSVPMAIACIESVFLKRAESRRVMLVFQIVYSIISAAVIYRTFAGERDAQYQLNLLLIPLIGFPSVLIAGLIAAFWKRA